MHRFTGDSPRVEFLLSARLARQSRSFVFGYLCVSLVLSRAAFERLGVGARDRALFEELAARGAALRFCWLSAVCVISASGTLVTRLDLAGSFILVLFVGNTRGLGRYPPRPPGAASVGVLFVYFPHGYSLVLLPHLRSHSFPDDGGRFLCRSLAGRGVFALLSSHGNLDHRWRRGCHWRLVSLLRALRVLRRRRP